MIKNFKIMGSKTSFNDIIYTPDNIVKDIINWVKPSGKILDPFKGKGAFYNQLIKISKTVDWTEITENRDFFKYNKKVDFIISNPPYSIFTKILEHSFKLSDNVIFLIPHMKIYCSDKRLNMIEKYGTFKCLRFKVPKSWSINFPIAAYWFRRK